MLFAINTTILASVDTRSTRHYSKHECSEVSPSVSEPVAGGGSRVCDWYAGFMRNVIRHKYHDFGGVDTRSTRHYSNLSKHGCSEVSPSVSEPVAGGGSAQSEQRPFSVLLCGRRGFCRLGFGPLWSCSATFDVFGEGRARPSQVGAQCFVKF